MRTLPAAAIAEEMAHKFARCFPVKCDGTPATFSWEHARAVYRGDPEQHSRGSQRSDGMSWAIWAAETVIGNPVFLVPRIRAANHGGTLSCPL